MADLLNKTQVFPVSQKGVTLVELMVGIAIGLLVISVAVGALMVSRNISGTVSDATGIQQQAAYAMRVIGQQVRQAGSLRLNLDPLNSGDDYLIPVALETIAPATGAGNAFDPRSTRWPEMIRPWPWVIGVIKKLLMAQRQLPL